MELYLRKCLNSLLIKENFYLLDVIIVNDGSTDKSINIAKEYVNKYPTVFRIIDKPNGNYGSCVNIGLKNAKGKYIKVLDADDWFNSHALELILSKIQDINDDVIITDAVYSTNGVEKKMDSISLPPYKHLQMSSFLLSHTMLNIQMHQVMYKTKMLHSIDYYQSEGISYTDQEWIFLPIALSETFYYVPISLYVYLLGREGQTMDKNILIKNISHTEKGVIKMVDDYKRYYKLLLPKQEKYLKRKICGRINYIYRTYLFNKKLQESDLIKFDTLLKTNCMSIYKCAEKIILHRFYPIHYIKAWHNNNVFLLNLWRYLTNKE